MFDGRSDETSLIVENSPNLRMAAKNSPMNSSKFPKIEKEVVAASASLQSSEERPESVSKATPPPPPSVPSNGGENRASIAVKGIAGVNSVENGTTTLEPVEASSSSINNDSHSGEPLGDDAYFADKKLVRGTLSFNGSSSSSSPSNSKGSVPSSSAMMIQITIPAALTQHQNSDQQVEFIFDSLFENYEVRKQNYCDIFHLICFTFC